MKQFSIVGKKFINKFLSMIKILLFLLTIIFVSSFIYKNIFAIQEFKISFDVKIFLISIITVWAWLAISATIYHFIIKKLLPNANYESSLSIWSFSYLGRYLPSKIGVATLRVAYYQKLGVSSVIVSYVMFVEMVISILSSVFVVLLSSLFIKLPYVFDNILVIIVIFFVLLISISPNLISFYTKVYYKLIKKDNKIHITPYNYAFYLKILLLQLFKWIIIGFGIFILVNSVTTLSIEYFPYITGLYAFAAISGMLAVFAPSGLGVVEGIMIVGLKSIISNTNASIVVILVRLWKILGELSFILFVKIITKI